MRTCRELTPELFSPCYGDIGRRVADHDRNPFGYDPLFFAGICGPSPRVRQRLSHKGLAALCRPQCPVTRFTSFIRSRTNLITSPSAWFATSWSISAMTSGGDRVGLGHHGGGDTTAREPRRPVGATHAWRA